MKKRHLFWIIPTCLIAGLLVLSLIAHLISPVESKRMVKKSKVLNELTLEQQKKDLDYLRYYLTQHYINYDTMVENGFDIDDVFDQIEKALKKDRRNNNTIESSTFRATISNIIIKNLNVVDKHFAVCGVYLKDNIFYFSDIYIKAEESKTGIKYFVVKNQEEEFPENIKKYIHKLEAAEIKPGQEYTGSPDNLYEWFDGNEKIYRFGTMAKGDINYAYIQIDGKPVKAPVRSTYNLTNVKAQGFKETDKSLYLSLSNFMFEQGAGATLQERNKNEFDKLIKNAKEKSKGKENIIIDLRSNPGGELLRSAMILGNLFYDEKDISSDLLQYLTNLIDDDYVLYSPSIGSLNRSFFFNQIISKFKNRKNNKKNEKHESEIYSEEVYKMFHRQRTRNAFLQLLFPNRKIVKFPYKKSQVTQLPENTFHGTIYLLTDHHSGSCSEYTVALAHNLAKNTDVKICQIGQNTNGAVFYFNPHAIVLPYSGGWLTLPTAVNRTKNFDYENFKGEGLGWYPDYWCSNQNIANTLVNLTGDNQLQESLKGLEKGQL